MTALRPDEVECQYCHNVFVSPEAYEAHIPRKNGCWPSFPNGLQKNEKTQRWSFDGKDTRPRRTQAQAAFDRLVESSLNWPRSQCGKASVQADIDKVHRALKKARDA